MKIILLIIGFVLLVKGADYFVDGCSKVAASLGIPSLVIGLTIVAFGTSAPETAVSVIASLKGNSDIAIGNAVGSNICNLLLVLGISGLFGELKAKEKIITRDYLYLMLSGIVLFILTAGTFYHHNEIGFISRTNGAILICFLMIYVYALLLDSKKEIKEKTKKTKISFKDIIFIIIGLIGIIAGGQLVVNSATGIAKILGISDSLIALTIVAIGTSLPELVTSAIATKKGETDIAIGNVIGSNIFNIFFVLGLASITNPLTINFNTFIDIIIMNITAIIVYFLMLKNNRIGNKKGIIILILYIAYTTYLIMR